MYRTEVAVSGDFRISAGTWWRKISKRFVKAFVQLGLASLEDMGVRSKIELRGIGIRPVAG